MKKWFRFRFNLLYTTLTNLCTKYLVMCKVYIDVGGINWLNHVCPPVHKIIHSLELVNYLHIQTDNPWHNYYITSFNKISPANLPGYASSGSSFNSKEITDEWIVAFFHYLHKFIIKAISVLFKKVPTIIPNL